MHNRKISFARQRQRRACLDQETPYRWHCFGLPSIRPLIEPVSQKQKLDFVFFHQLLPPPPPSNSSDTFPPKREGDHIGAVAKARTVTQVPCTHGDTVTVKRQAVMRVLQVQLCISLNIMFDLSHMQVNSSKNKKNSPPNSFFENIDEEWGAV